MVFLAVPIKVFYYFFKGVHERKNSRFAPTPTFHPPCSTHAPAPRPLVPNHPNFMPIPLHFPLRSAMLLVLVLILANKVPALTLDE